MDADVPRETDKRFLQAFVACEVLIRIDDLALSMTFVTKRERLYRVYEVGHLKSEVVAFIHMMESR
jgi:hypothetical protein